MSDHDPDENRRAVMEPRDLAIGEPRHEKCSHVGPVSAMRGDLLFADDEPGLRVLFRYTFEPLGYRVTAVEDGESAIREIEASAPDLVVLDLNMPGIGGAAALREILRIRPTQRVLLMSGSAAGWDGAEPTLATRAVGLLQKPVSLQELVDAVEAALAIPPSS